MDNTSDFESKLQRRRAALKDSLKSTSNEESLLKDLKERRQLRWSLVSSDAKSVPLSGKDISTEDVDSSLKVHKLREKGKVTRFDEVNEPTSVPSRNLLREDKSSLKEDNSSRWKLLTSNIKETIEKNNHQEAYDFFTSALSNSCEVSGYLNSNQQSDNDELPETRKLDATADHCHHVGYPLYTPQQERLSKEAEVYFRPEPIPAEVIETSHCDDEGLYIGEKPKIFLSQVRMMENRISKREKDSSWIGEDDLLVQRNPLRVLHTRPHLHISPADLCTFKSVEMNLKTIGNEGSDDVYQLHLDISSIKFTHHHLFSAEHVVASELESTYWKYHNRDKNAVEYFNEKLSALKAKTASLKHRLKEMNPSTDAEKVQSFISVYRKEIHTVRQHKKKTVELEYTMLKNILRLWKDLKMVRDNQGYSNTTIYLTFTKLETDRTQDEAQQAIDLEEELLELREEFDEQFDLQISKDESNVHEEEAEAGVLAPNNDFDEVQERQKLSEYFSSNHRPPGEPVFVPQLHHNNSITQHCPATEQLRRDDVARTRLHIKVFFNDHQVSQTKESHLNSEFSVHFGEVFTVEVLQWPESIKLQIFETKLLSSSIIAEVYLPIPDVQLTSESLSSTDQYLFTSKKRISYSHTAVGSGSNTTHIPSLTSGCVTSAVCWGMDNKGRVLCPPNPSAENKKSANYTDVVASLGISGTSNLQDVKKWIASSRLDPNDPRNATLIHLIESIPSCTEQTNYFQLMNVDDIQRFILDDDFSADKRFTMICMRSKQRSGLQNKVVPLSSKMIGGSLWKKLMDYKFSDYELPLTILGDFYSTRREEQNKFLLDIRERVLSQIHSRPTAPMLSEVVISDFIPNISSLQSSIVELFVPRRPLKPVRRERKKLKSQTMSSANILVRIIRAFNVPIRESDSTVEQSDADQLTEIVTSTSPASPFDKNQGIVSPFIEVGFDDIFLRTTSVCGPNPFWNEELTFPVQLPTSDHSSQKLQMLSKTIHINLFDEVVVDILEDQRRRSTTVHHRIEKRWIGKLAMPLSTLILRQMIEGTFQLDIPPMLLGYQKCSNNSSLKFSQHTHLQIYISLDPPLAVLPPIKDQFPSNEEPLMLERASKWLRTLRAKFPERFFTGTALDISGRHIFITRFIKPQNSPPEITSPQTNNIQFMESLAHYVSLIPFLSDSLLFSENYNIWSTSDQFLRMLGGDEEEHAILLCNFLLFAGIKAWVILGHAVPEGETAYVLTENPTSEGSCFLLWNASTGVHYNQHEPHLPLISVGCVFNDMNVWGNVQAYDDPSRLMFDLTDTKQWLPLFAGLDDTKSLVSVQQDLQYSDTDKARVLGLQERIERSLRDHIMTLRKNFITRWNRHCTRILKAVLPILEKRAFSLQDLHSELVEIKASYKLVGFPIHVRYSDLQQLLTSVERTGIHLCENKNVEYSLAVYVHAYSNDVLSVWIYVVYLVPKN